MSIITPVVFAAAALSICASSCGANITKDHARGFLMKTINAGGNVVKYVVYVPEAYDPAKPMPAILFLNGSGECGTDGLMQISAGLGFAIQKNVKKWPFIVIFPQKQIEPEEWQNEDAMVMAILNEVHGNYNIDSSRIYLTGISQGGHGTWMIAAKHPDIFAAIAPICGWAGNIWKPEDKEYSLTNKETASKVAKLPIWIFHGEADPVVPVKAAKDMAECLKSVGADFKITIYPGVQHGSWDKAYEENLPEWFLEHHK